MVASVSTFVACKLEVDTVEPLLPRHESGEYVDLVDREEEDGDEAKASQGQVVKEVAVTSKKVKQKLCIDLVVQRSLIVMKIAEWRVIDGSTSS